MSIQVIVSTVNNKIENINKSIKNLEDYIVINQITHKKSGRIQKKKNKKGIWIDYEQKGLSNSRNLAIKTSTAEYIYLADDDVELSNSFENDVLEGISNNPQADILVFNVEGIKNNAKATKKVGFLASMKLSSVQLIYKLDFIKDNNLKFDSSFGAGSYYKMGEENIFLFDSLKKKANIIHIPTTIAKLNESESSWFEGFNQKYFYDRGAIFSRMFGKFMGTLFSIRFCISKRKLYKNNIKITDAIKHSFLGIKEYKKNYNYT